MKAAQRCVTTPHIYCTLRTASKRGGALRHGRRSPYTRRPSVAPAPPAAPKPPADAPQATSGETIASFFACPQTASSVPAPQAPTAVRSTVATTVFGAMPTLALSDQAAGKQYEHFYSFLLYHPLVITPGHLPRSVKMYQLTELSVSPPLIP